MRTRSSRSMTFYVQSLGRKIAVPVALAAFAAVAFQAVSVSPAGAKTPGSTYCYYGKCHRVKSIAETEALIGQEETLVASHYDSCKKDRYNPCGLTSSGERFDPEAADNAASPIYPDGTKLLVWSPETGVAIVLRVNNAGPYWGNRKLDVSRGAAERLGFAGKGVATVKVRVLDAPTVDEATYKRNRTYDPVPGYIGRFASTETAHVALASVTALDTLAQYVGVPSNGQSVTMARSGMLEAGQPPVQVAAAQETRAPTASVQRPRREAPKLSTPNLGPEQILALPFVTAAQVASIIIDGPKPAILSPAAPRKQIAARDTAPSRAAKQRAVRVATAKARPTRSARLAMAKSKPGNRNRVASLARTSKPKVTLAVTGEGTNDMSVFSRHAQTQQTFRQVQAEQRARKQPDRYRQTAALHRGRDRGDG